MKIKIFEVGKKPFTSEVESTIDSLPCDELGKKILRRAFKKKENVSIGFNNFLVKISK